MEEAWLIASVELGMGDIRSGVLIAALLSNPNRYGFSDYMELLEAIPAEELRRHLPDITAGSSEASTVMGVEKPAAGESALPAHGKTRRLDVLPLISPDVPVPVKSIRCSVVTRRSGR